MARIFLKILVIIILLVAAAGMGAFFLLPQEYERNFGGTFVRCNFGYLHQAQEKGGLA
ncbi:MAG: hypothetical protein FWF77_01915 [Defluviitaleaceae bacterium]|nr:hypothetical protein [Defluviitaleaceae bacterium]